MRTRQVLCSIWPVLQPRIKPHRAGFVWPEKNWPQLCLVVPKVFYSISVTDGVSGLCDCCLWLAYLGTLGWLHRHYWKRAELDDVNTAWLSIPMNWLKLDKWLLHYWQTIFLFDSEKLLQHYWATETTPYANISTSDLDMWGHVWMSSFTGAWQNLNFYKEYLFGFETLVFATSGNLSMHKQLVTLQREHTTWNRIIWPL